MYNSLTCVVKSSVDSKNYGQLFGSVCGLDNNACNGINTNSSNGAFGAYGMCNATEQLSFAFNQYYMDNNSGASACDFGGAASTKSATSATGGCSSLVAQAGTAGTGTVTAGAQGTGSGSNGGSGGNSGSGSSSGKSAAAPGVSVQNAFWQIPLLVSLAALSGMGMILL